MRVRVPRRLTATCIVAGCAWLLHTHAASAQSDNPLAKFLPRPQHVVITPNLTAAVKPGATLTLTVGVTPNAGIHVYAPGAKGYLPIALMVSPVPHTLLGKTVYPRSEIVVFADERVAVYQKAFTLSRALTVDSTAKPGALTIAGTVNYQACNETVCFAPESIPVSWSVVVK
jgi:DsbC/DsbD-like thiol-disulfide interchange protein